MIDFGNAMTEPTPCCVRLRCKSLFYRNDERPGLLHNEEAMTYWCDKTNEALGPTGEPVVHRLCQPGRSCYEPGPEI